MKKNYLNYMIASAMSLGLVACGSDNDKVTSVKENPVVSAGSAATIGEGEAIKLEGSSASAQTGFSIETYQWEQVSGPAIIISNADTLNPTILAPSVEDDAQVRLRLTVTSSATENNVASSEVVIKITNDPELPEVRALTTIDAQERQQVVLRSIGYFDADDVLATSFKWRQVSGTDVGISDDGTDTLSFQAPAVSYLDETSKLVFEVIAMSGNTESVPATFEVTVHNVAIMPTADAGIDQTLPEGQQVTLSGAGIAVDGEPAIGHYHWTQVSGPTVTLSDDSITNPTFVAPEVNAATDVVFDLVASNGLSSDGDQVIVTITNTTPIAEAGATITIAEGESFTLDGSASTANGEREITAYEWTAADDTLAVDNNDLTSAVRTLVAPGIDEDSKEFQYSLRVSDTQDTSPSDTVIVRVVNGGDVPVASTLGEGTAEGQQKTTIVVDAEPSSDPKNRVLTYTWTQVLGADEAAVPFTTTENGRLLNIAAPAVDDETALTFELVVNNGVNASDPHTVSVKVIAEESYVGGSVQLKGNPFSIVNESLDLSAYGELYNIELVGTNAYITYHSMSEISSGKRTGLLIVDLSDESDLKVIKNYTLPYSDVDSGSRTPDQQYKLAVDPAEQYAFVVERNMIDEDDFNHLVRIDLSVEPAADMSHLVSFTFVEDDDIEEVADVVYRNGSLYLAAFNDRAIYKMDPAADPAAPAMTRIWFDNPPEEVANFSPREAHTAGTLESLKIVDDGEGSAAVLFNGDAMQVVRFDAMDNVITDYDVRPHSRDVDFDLDYRRFKKPNQSQLEKVVSLSVDASTDYVYVTFQENSESDSTRRFGAVERIDIRDPAANTIDSAGLHFQTREDAFGVMRAGDLTFVGGGIQGLQVLQNVVSEADGESIQLKTYYQTPMRAEDVVVSSDMNRAIVIGDSALAVVDLSVQAAPAMATDWAAAYARAAVVQSDKRTNGLAVEGSVPGRAGDVEIVKFYSPMGVMEAEYAVVLQGPGEGQLNADAGVVTHNLYIYDINAGSIAPTVINLVTGPMAWDFKSELDELQLSQIGGDIYLTTARVRGQGTWKLPHASIRTVTDATAHDDFIHFFEKEINALGFVDADRAFFAVGNESRQYFYNLSADGSWVAEETPITNFSFYDNAIGFTEGASHMLAVGRAQGNSSGCLLFDMFDEDGDAAANSTSARIGFDVDFGREGDPTDVYDYPFTGAVDMDREVCFAGWGWEQTGSFEESDWDNELGTENGPERFILQAVSFTQSIASIETTGDSNTDPYDDDRAGDYARVSLFDLPDNPEDITRVGNRLYVAANTFGGVQIIDATDPMNLALEGIIHTEDSANGVAVNHDQTKAVIADDNMTGIMQTNLYYPWLERTDNDAQTKAIVPDTDPAQLVMTPEQVAFADAHAWGGQSLTYTLSNVEPGASVICYTSEDMAMLGNENCQASVSEEGVYTISWTLSEREISEGDVVDQTMRIAVGNNIQFLSASAKVFVSKAAEVADMPMTTEMPAANTTVTP